MQGGYAKTTCKYLWPSAMSSASTTARPVGLKYFSSASARASSKPRNSVREAVVLEPSIRVANASLAISPTPSHPINCTAICTRRAAELRTATRAAMNTAIGARKNVNHRIPTFIFFTAAQFRFEFFSYYLNYSYHFLQISHADLLGTLLAGAHLLAGAGCHTRTPWRRPVAESGRWRLGWKQM